MSAVRFAELHAHSTFSLSDAVPFPEELTEHAASLGLAALALTDHDGLYAAVPFYRCAKEVGLKPILGSELTLEDGSHLTLLAENQQGYSNLSQLVSQARMNTRKGSAALPWPVLAEHAAGVICLTGCSRGLVAQRLLVRDERGAAETLTYLLEAFGRGSVFIELQRHRLRADRRLVRQLVALAGAFHVPFVATNNVHYLTPADADLHDVLVCIRERVPLSEAKRGVIRRYNDQYHLRSPAEMAWLYADLPQAVANTLVIAERCNVTLPDGLQTLPTFPTPDGIPAIAYVRQLCQAELPKRFPKTEPQATRWLEKELGIVERLGLANYFLILWDLMRYSREQGILGHGRGSAANSLAAYLLRITSVDPIAHGLVPERFFNVQEGALPDVDIDFPSFEQREQVIQYLYERYGRDFVAMACTFVTWRSASAIRDAGFVLGFKPEAMEHIARALEENRKAQHLDEDGRVEVPDVPLTASSLAAGELSARERRRLVALAERLRKRPRHLGIHNGGVILTGPLLAQLIPIEPARMPGRTVTQWDKEFLEDSGFVKIDILGLRTLAAISDVLELILQTQGSRVDVFQLDYADPKVYAQVCAGEVIGLFQLESPSQSSLIPKLQPRTFHALMIQVSLIRPGPLQANMVRPFLARWNGLEPVTYLHPSLELALKETLGIVIWQEQVIKVAMSFADFTPERGERLRRALGSKHADEAIAAFQDEFIEGAIAKGVDYPTARKVWEMLRGFGGYSFSKAHAASFAAIAYWTAYLRVYYPVEYFAALLRNAPLGSYAPHSLEAEARRKGIRFLKFDINHSEVQPTVENGAIRHGLKDVRNVGESLARRIVEARGSKPYTSLVGFIQRTEIVDHQPLRSLIRAGAFDAFGERRQVLWKLADALKIAQRPQPALSLFDEDTLDEQAELKPMTLAEQTLETFGATGYTVDTHLAELRRAEFAQAGCRSYAEVRRMRPSPGVPLKIGGLVMDGPRRPPTAHGLTFVRLEDGEGIADIIVPEEVYAQYWSILRHSRTFIVEGVLQRTWPTLSLLAQRIYPL